MVAKRLLTSLACVAALVASLAAQESTAILPLGEVRPGQKGVGRTIFAGDKIEEFQVEILGVLKNAVAPKRDVILARLAGGPLEKTGVIAGMSGSPVYVDGKLVGAVALSFPFAKEPLAGITPIEEMLAVAPSPTPAPPVTASHEGFRISQFTEGGSGGGRLISSENANLTLSPPPAETGAVSPSLTSLLLPLRFGGFASEVINQFAPEFRRLGFEPLEGGVIAGSEETVPPSPSDLAPGSMISLLFVRGDLNLNVDCTVTFRRGDDLYACGHRVLSIGPARFPFAPSHVIATVSSLAASFKVDAPGAVAGTIRQDWSSAIYGLVGEKNPPMIPIHLHIESTQNQPSDYRFEMIEEPFLSPLFANVALLSALSATERVVGASTLDLKGTIQLEGGQSVNLEDIVSSEAGAPTLAAATVAAPLSLLMSSGFPDLKVRGVDLRVLSTNEKRTASLEEVWSTKSEVRPGERLDLTALLRLPGGERIAERIPVEVPASVSDKMLSVVVGSGSSINALEFRFSPLGASPRDLGQLVRAMNRMRRNNRVYALLMAPQRSFVMQGDEYPSPPPSLLQTFLADPSATSNVIFSGTSVVGDFESKPTIYTIHGQRTLLLKVTGPGT